MYMQGYFGMLRAERKRIFSIRNIGFTVLALVVFIGISWLSYYKKLGGTEITFYGMFSSIMYGGLFYELAFIPASFYVMINLCEDINQKSVYLYSSRANIKAYILSKSIIGVAFTMLTVFAAWNICMFIGTRVFTVVDYEYTDMDVYRDVLEKNVYWYFQLRILYFSLATGLFTSMGCLLTTIIPNKYVAVTAPYFMFMAFFLLQSMMHMPTNSILIFFIAGVIRVSSSLFVSIAYILMYFLIGIISSTYLYYKIMLRRCYGERK